MLTLNSLLLYYGQYHTKLLRQQKKDQTSKITILPISFSIYSLKKEQYTSKKKKRYNATLQYLFILILLIKFYIWCFIFFIYSFDYCQMHLKKKSNYINSVT